MTNTPNTGGTPSSGNRLADLLADHAVFGLAADEQRELDRLIAEHDATGEIEAHDRAAAAFYLATTYFSTTPADAGPLPEHLRSAVLESHRPERAAVPDALSVPNAPTKSEAPRRPPEQRSETRRSETRRAWPLAIAASLLIGAAVGGLLSDRGRGPGSPSHADARAALLDSTTPLTRVAWTPTDPASGVAGDVVWSDAEQRGYMTFRGLPANDPSTEQYQLWVFDGERDAERPVDGGVFDIPPDPSGGGAVVPIDAKLRIGRAVMFAVTIERPGGVVVSDRSRLPLLAKVE